MQLFKLSDVARLFNASISTVKRWVDEGKLETEQMPGGAMRRVTAAAIRAFARHHGPARLVTFGGILAIGTFNSPPPEGVAHVNNGFEAGRLLEAMFPSVILVSFVDYPNPMEFPAEARQAGYDGMVACVVNDDDATELDTLQAAGWQMVCRAGEDYWGAAAKVDQSAQKWNAMRAATC